LDFRVEWTELLHTHTHELVLYRRVNGYAIQVLSPCHCAVCVCELLLHVLWRRKRDATLSMLIEQRPGSVLIATAVASCESAAWCWYSFLFWIGCAFGASQAC
jgi:hypothetical protein